MLSAMTDTTQADVIAHSFVAAPKSARVRRPGYLFSPVFDFLTLGGGSVIVCGLIALAWKHPNVFLELGAHRPKYFAAPGAGWDALMRFGQTTIAPNFVNPVAMSPSAALT